MGSSGSRRAQPRTVVNQQVAQPIHGAPPPAPAYSNAPPPAYSEVAQPPPATYNPPTGFQQQQPRGFQGQQQFGVPPGPNSTVVVQGGFDAGARFVNGQAPTIPPPPPGFAPNAAQAAAMQGQNVVVTQQQGSFWSGSGDGGMVIW